MRVLVTGATGFIGSALVPQVQSHGYDVVAGVRSPVETKVGEYFLIGDIWAYHGSMDLSGFDAVIHLAGPAHGNVETSVRDPEDYATSVLELARSADSSRVSRFIFISSVKAAGERSLPDHPLRESDVAHPSDWYGRAKHAAEVELQDFVPANGMTIQVLRPPLVYAENAPKNFGQLMRLAKSALPLPVGSFDMPRSLVHRNNLCQAIIHLLSLPTGSTFEMYYVRDGRDISPADMIRRIRSMRERPRRVFRVPMLSRIVRQFAGTALADRLVQPLQVSDDKLRSTGWTPALTVGQGLAQSVELPPLTKRLMLVITEDWYFLSHRKDLALAAREAGWEVHLACRVRDHGDTIRRLGIILHELSCLDRRSMNPLAERRAIRELQRRYAQVNPDVVHHVALKPIIYGTLAARRNGMTAIVNALAGMGSAFTRGKGLGVVPRRVSRFLLDRSLRNSSIVVVQNGDDRDLVTSSLGVSDNKVRVIPGSGVCLEDFPERTASDRNVVTVCYSGRMLRDKGVVEFIKAIGLLDEKNLPVEGLLIGKLDPDNPSGLSVQELRTLLTGSAVRWLGHQDNVSTLLASCDVAVLASYREGLPKSLLEAASTGLPLIATDVPGCREIVKQGVTGLLVPPQDVAALANAIQTLVESPELRSRYGSAARELVEQKFSSDVILPEFLALYDDVAGVGRHPTG